MSNNINDLKKDAENLKSNLEKIVKEAESYKKASDELKTASDSVVEMTGKLGDVIDASLTFVNESEKVLDDFSRITERIETIEKNLLREIKTSRFTTIGLGAVAIVGIIVSIII